ncbi:hypothetical protein KUCAC02_025066, partial [Chaenocephalus aceratus]
HVACNCTRRLVGVRSVTTLCVPHTATGRGPCWHLETEALLGLQSMQTRPRSLRR